MLRVGEGDENGTGYFSRSGTFVTGFKHSLGASAVNSPPLAFKYFDVSGIAETWKCPPSLSFVEHGTLNVEPQR